MKLVSFSSRESSHDIINTVTLDFTDTKALLSFLDPSGGRAELNMEDGSGNLRIILNEPVSSEINENLMDLLRQVSEGYSFRISFSANGNSTLTFIDGYGRTIEPPSTAAVTPSGRRVSMEIPTMDLLDLRGGLGISLIW
jgi:hypothetical protein